MGRQIELPAMPTGTTEKQLENLYSYLYQMAVTLNSNLAEIGGAELTDTEQAAVREIIGTGETETMDGRAEAETLKSLIIKTASFVKSALNQYRLNLLGEYVAEGKFGKYVRNTGLNVDVTPTGIQQEYTFKEIIQGLKTYEINAKNYIYCGLLRTVNSVPVYGVAIGKDVVTFAQDGTETYVDGNKVAELTADELSFYQNSSKVASYKGDEISFYQGGNKVASLKGNELSFYQGGNKVASFTGNKISFFYNGAETFYIQNGKLYSAQDLELGAGKKVMIGDWDFSDGGLKLQNGSDPTEFQIANTSDEVSNSCGLFYNTSADAPQYKAFLKLKARTYFSDTQTGRIAEVIYLLENTNATLYPNKVYSNYTFDLGLNKANDKKWWDNVFAEQIWGHWMMSADHYSDINDFWDNGVYKIDGDESNLPTGYTDTLAFLRVMSYTTSGTTVAQQTLIGERKIYIRRGNTQTGWDSWWTINAV